MIEEAEIKDVLFGPRDGKSLLRSHPELAAEPLFKVLAQDDLLFAWYIGIPESPVDHNWPSNTRYKTAAAKCFPSNEDKRHKFTAYDIDENIRLAIEKFKTFSPEARRKGKVMVQRMMENWSKLVDVDVDKDFFYNDKDGNEQIDWTGRKQYIDSTRAISEALPSVLKQLEEGFGVTESKKKSEELGKKSIDLFHQRKKDKS